MPDTAARVCPDSGPANRRASLAEHVRLRTLVILVVAIFVPICIAGTGDLQRAPGWAERVLVSQVVQPEAPAEADAASAALGLNFPAGLPSGLVLVPEPDRTRLALGNVDLFPGRAHRLSLAPPPRRS